MRVVYEVGGPDRIVTLFDTEVPREGATVQMFVNGEPTGPSYFANEVVWCVDTQDADKSYVRVVLAEDS